MDTQQESHTVIVDEAEVEEDLQRLSDAVRSKEQIVLLGATALAQYGERDLIREMAARLIMLHPQAKAIGPAGMAAAAQIAVFAGASPLPGLNELHVWKDKEGNVIIMLGINYDRRRITEVAGGVAWIEKPRPMTQAEREDFGVKSGYVAFICKGLRQDKFMELYHGGVGINDIFKMFGGTGVGVVAPNEYDKKGRPTGWTAEKRAEADLCRKLVPNLADPGRAQSLAQSREHLLRLDELAHTYTGDPRSLPVEAQKVAMRAAYGMTQEEEPVDYGLDDPEYTINGKTLDLEIWLAEMPSTDAVLEVAAREFDYGDALEVAQRIGDAIAPSNRSLSDLGRLEIWRLAEQHKPAPEPVWTPPQWKEAIEQSHDESKVAAGQAVTEPQRRAFFRLLEEANVQSDDRSEIIGYLFNADGLSKLDRRAVSAFIDVATARQAVGHLEAEMGLLTARKVA